MSQRSHQQKYGSLFLSQTFCFLFDQILRLPLGSETMVSAGAFSQPSQVLYGFLATQLEDVVGDSRRPLVTAIAGRHEPPAGILWPDLQTGCRMNLHRHFLSPTGSPSRLSTRTARSCPAAA
jgi:hypothetical protein